MENKYMKEKCRKSKWYFFSFFLKLFQQAFWSRREFFSHRNESSDRRKSICVIRPINCTCKLMVHGSSKGSLVTHDEAFPSFHPVLQTYTDLCLFYSAAQVDMYLREKKKKNLQWVVAVRTL